MNASAEAMASLRLAGAERFDPVRWNFIEALSRRAAQQSGRVRQILEAKLAAALADLKQRFEQAQRDADAVAVGGEPHRGSSLAEILREIAPPASSAGAQPELKAARYFRNTWSKQSVERQVGLAIDQAPPNAGPLNSHFLVLRSLTLMRDVAPDYLNRFTSYVDTLLCLDAAAQTDKPAVKKPAKARAAKVGVAKARAAKK